MTYTTKDGVTILIDTPEGEKKETRYSHPAFVRACRNNENAAALLDYFVYAASKEAPDKSCKVVTVTRTHKQILQTLATANCKMSRKSLIRYMDNLNEWKLVLSQPYQRDFIVDLTAIQETVNNPPQVLPRTRKSSEGLQEKGGQVTTLQPFEKVDKLQPSNVEELKQKVDMLQQKVEELQLKGGQVTTFLGQVTTLQRDFEALQKLVQDHLFSSPIITSNILPIITNKSNVILSDDENHATPILDADPDFLDISQFADLIAVDFAHRTQEQPAPVEIWTGTIPSQEETPVYQFTTTAEHLEQVLKGSASPTLAGRNLDTPYQGNAQRVHPEHSFIAMDDLDRPTVMVVTLTPAFPHPHSSEMEDKRRERIAAWEVLPIYKKQGLEVEVRWVHETERQTVDAGTIVESTAVVGGNSPSIAQENTPSKQNGIPEPPVSPTMPRAEPQGVNVPPTPTQPSESPVHRQEMLSSTQGVDESHRQEMEQQQANGVNPIATATIENSPAQPPKTSRGRGGKGKKEEQPKLEVVKTPPQMPPAEMAWGTRKCMQKFDARRGTLLIGTYAITQASTCAKGLAENYSEEDVDAVTEKMNNDPYWMARGGADICDVARNIHKEIKKIKGQNRTTSSRSGNTQQPAPAACMTHDEACKLAHDAITQAKQYGYDIQAQAVTSKKVEGAWIVKVKWDNEDGFVVPPIRTREQWQKEFKSMHENLSIQVLAPAKREAK